MNQPVVPGAPAKEPVCRCRQADGAVRQRLAAATGGASAAIEKPNTIMAMRLRRLENRYFGWLRIGLHLVAAGTLLVGCLSAASLVLGALISLLNGELADFVDDVLPVTGSLLLGMFGSWSLTVLSLLLLRVLRAWEQALRGEPLEDQEAEQGARLQANQQESKE